VAAKWHGDRGNQVADATRRVRSPPSETVLNSISNTPEADFVLTKINSYMTFSLSFLSVSIHASDGHM